MKINHIFLYLVIILCMVPNHRMSAVNSNDVNTVIHYTKLTVGYSMLAIGVPCLLSGITGALQGEQDVSVEGFRKLAVYLSFGIGIPNTLLGLLLVLPDKQVL